MDTLRGVRGRSARPDLVVPEHLKDAHAGETLLHTDPPAQITSGDDSSCRITPSLSSSSSFRSVGHPAMYCMLMVSQ